MARMEREEKLEGWAMNLVLNHGNILIDESLNKEVE